MTDSPVARRGAIGFNDGDNAFAVALGELGFADTAAAGGAQVGFGHIVV